MHTGDNGCNYGACYNPLAVDSYHTRCVHDASFCSTVEQYYTAEQVWCSPPRPQLHPRLAHISPPYGYGPPTDPGAE